MTRLKRLAAGLLATALVATPLAAEDVVYTEGESEVRYATGEQQEAQIGDVLATGDSVRTGNDGRVELDKQSATIRIAPGTVFTISETADASGPRSTLSIALGAARFKFARFSGAEPRISTMSVVAGVRGTEFSVYAGADGSTAITVDEGSVELAAAGQSVTLGAAEGAEVRPGAPPGEKFDFSSGEFDFSAWNADLETAMLADPIAALKQAERQMDLFIGELRALAPLFAREKAQLDRDTDRLQAIEDTEERGAFYRSTVLPREEVASELAINMRFNALSALSLRRFVLGRMYLKLKGEALSGDPHPAYRQYLRDHARLLEKYERDVVPHLVVADI